MKGLSITITCFLKIISGAKKLPCNHIFHATCLRSWFQRQQTCPTCRLEVLRTPGANQAPAGGAQQAAAAAANVRPTPPQAPQPAPQVCFLVFNIDRNFSFHKFVLCIKQVPVNFGPAAQPQPPIPPFIPPPPFTFPFPIPPHVPPPTSSGVNSAQVEGASAGAAAPPPMMPPPFSFPPLIPFSKFRFMLPFNFY